MQQVTWDRRQVVASNESHSRFEQAGYRQPPLRASKESQSEAKTVADPGPNRARATDAHCARCDRSDSRGVNA